MSVCALHPEADSTPPLMTRCVTAGTRRRNIDILCYRVNIKHSEWHGVKVCVCVWSSLLRLWVSLTSFCFFVTCSHLHVTTCNPKLYPICVTGLTLIRGIIFKRVINDSWQVTLTLINANHLRWCGAFCVKLYIFMNLAGGYVIRM